MIKAQTSGDSGKLLSSHRVLGEWHSEINTSVIIEYWEKVSENTFKGYGKTINKLDEKVTSFESLRLVEMSGEEFYIAKVSHNNYPVAFKLVEQNDSLLIFENKDHDFPKNIEYSFIGKDRMNVKVGDGDKQFTINFTRMEN
jgi:hypothetical protein